MLSILTPISQTFLLLIDDSSLKLTELTENVVLEVESRSVETFSNHMTHDRAVKGPGCSRVTHHWVAGLEDLTEQDRTLPLRKGLPEWTEAAGVSDVWTVHTLNTDTDTFTASGVKCFS